jgi:fatty-acyl-CoA synthase
MENQGIGSWATRRRVKSAGKTAFIFNDVATTYDEFFVQVNRLAHALRGADVTRGTRVAYLGENHPNFLVTFLATTQIGAIFVPLNTRLAPAEISYALDDSGASLLIHSGALAHLAVQGSAGMPVRLVQADGEPHEAGVTLLTDFTAGASEDFIDEPVGHDDPALILYTSGTTGHPKGAVLTHGNFLWNTVNALVDFDITSKEMSLMISPLFHVASLGMGALPMLIKGGTIVLEAGFDPGRALMLIEKYRITMLAGVPTTYQMMCEHPDWATTDLSSVHHMTCGGSAVPARVLNAYEERGLAFMLSYGMTESSPGATSMPARYSRDKAGSSGLPHYFVDMRIRDEQNADAPVGEVGEIQLRGPNVIAEYWNKPEASRDSFVDGNWFKTGDMGYVDADGFLFVADRIKDMIISGGENIYPAEIEQIIFELEGVTGVALIGVPDDKWGEVPWAVLTMAGGATLTLEQVRDHLDNRVARYKMPKNVIVVDEFPRTASGKIRKADLRKRYA